MSDSPTEVTVLATLLIGYGAGMLSMLSPVVAGMLPVTWPALGVSPETQAGLGVLTLVVGVAGFWHADQARSLDGRYRSPRIVF